MGQNGYNRDIIINRVKKKLRQAFDIPPAAKHRTKATGNINLFGSDAEYNKLGKFFCPIPSLQAWREEVKRRVGFLPGQEYFWSPE